MEILVLNCGSSSVKYGRFKREEAVVEGSIERIGKDESELTHRWEGETFSGTVQAGDHSEALRCVRDLILDPEKGGVRDAGEIAAVGHRVVHGGARFVEAVRITGEVEEAIEDHVFLAPLHNPANLAGIRAARRYFPEACHVAVFDTAFHRTMPEYAFLYALPYRLYERDRIRKYGFHGASHQFVAERAARRLGKEPDGFTGITCHLGNGCSVTAVREGRSVDTSMGFSPLEGTPMGTRPGDLDPGVILYLADRLGMSPAEINDLLNRESGLLGLSGVSNDLREIRKAAEHNRRAELAQEVFAYRIRKYIGAYLAVLGRIQAVVFTGGIGENAADMRGRILTGLEPLGLSLDGERNRNCVGREGEISPEGAPVKVLVIPTDEERVIARDTRRVARGSQGV